MPGARHGQQAVHEDQAVREAQPELAGHLVTGGHLEIRCRMTLSPGRWPRSGSVASRPGERSAGSSAWSRCSARTSSPASPQRWASGRCAVVPPYALQLMVAVFDFPAWSTGDDEHLVPELVVDRISD